MTKPAPILGEEAVDTRTGRRVWWDGSRWSYIRPQAEVSASPAPQAEFSQFLRQHPGDERLPLSYAQQRLWFVDRLGGGSTEYNLPEAMRLKGPLDRQSLERSIQAIVQRHESLRTHFSMAADQPEQVIARDLQIEIPLIDLTSFGQEAQMEHIRQAMRAEANTPFDLERGPLLRMKLLKLAEQEHILLRTMHHIVSDAWSHGVFNRELQLFYRSFRQGREHPLPPFALQYADFAISQRKWLEAGLLEEGLRYWKKQLADAPDRLELNTDRPRPPKRTFAAGAIEVTLSPELTGGLRVLAHANQATMYMVLLAAYAFLLSRYSGQEDVVVGTPIANRQDLQLEGLIGFFVNTLVMRTRLSAVMSWRELLAQVRATCLEAYEHQQIPFERLVEELSPERSLNRTPLFQAIFSLQNAPGAPLQMDELQMEQLEWEELKVRFDLEMHAWENENTTGMAWLYNRDLFDRWRIQQMTRHYQRILEDMVHDLDQTIGTADMLGPEERANLLKSWNQTARDLPALPVSALFELQVEKAPEATALAHGDREVSYRQLNEDANRLAHFLISQGVRTEDLVAIAMPRSIQMIVCFLAVLKAGAAYLPLDTDEPDGRLRVIFEDARPACVLVAQEFASKIPRGWRQLAVDASEIEEAAKLMPTSNPTSDVSGEINPQNAAYVMYTSGSTGAPKGVLITHAGIARLVLNADYAQITPQDRLAQIANPAFDAITFEVWGALLNGAMTVVIDKETVLDPEAFSRKLHRSRISVMFITASLFNHMVRHAKDAFSEVRHLLVGGEALDPISVRQVLAGFPPARLLNGYGPTETTTFATCFQVACADEMQRIPIGRPITHTLVYVLDRNLQPVPIGVSGELYISGPGLARGYFRRPWMTAERFVACPYGTPGARMYRTGDLVQWRVDGNLDFIRRLDSQIKLRGFRIELGEIEASLRDHESVEEAVVISREDQPGNKRLVAYVRSRDRKNDSDSLRQYLSEKLPAYMMPAAIVFMEKFPLTSNGKLDREVLPPPEFAHGGSSREPRTPHEEILAGLFAETLGVQRVGIDDSFFDLGGHSLLATQLISRIRSMLGVDVPIGAVFDAPSVAGMAEIVEAIILEQVEGMSEQEASRLTGQPE
jgi:pristinamycin I synthase 3 and 4